MRNDVGEGCWRRARIGGELSLGGGLWYLWLRLRMRNKGSEKRQMSKKLKDGLGS